MRTMKPTTPIANHSMRCTREQSLGGTCICRALLKPGHELADIQADLNSAQWLVAFTAVR